MIFKSINPATEELNREYAATSPEEIAAALDKAQQAFKNWRQLSYADRAEPMLRAANILTERKREFAGLLTSEMGKPIRQAVSEVEKCAWVCQFYAEYAAKMLEHELVPSDSPGSHVRFDPLGIVLAVMPWNFPFWQVFRFAAPALMAGNVALLKHAGSVPGSALQIEAIFREAGFPTGAFKTLLIDAATVQTLIAHPDVKAVTLTGSEAAGRSVAEAAGRNLKKVVLELGGSDPFIVFPDCDMEKTVQTAVQAKIFNTGQSCIAAKRFILVGEARRPFTENLLQWFQALPVGDPVDEKNELGPLARMEFLYELDRQVRESVRLGARVLCGGQRLDRPGYFYAPTILDQVQRGMPAYEEEVFGPVAALISVADEAEALDVSNDTRFGLGASLWTSDRKLAERMAARIESGMVFVNGMVKSDPRLPFGGVKSSGYGRELSHYGIKEFVNIKTVWIG